LLRVLPGARLPWHGAGSLGAPMGRTCRDPCRKRAVHVWSAPLELLCFSTIIRVTNVRAHLHDRSVLWGLVLAIRKSLDRRDLPRIGKCVYRLEHELRATPAGSAFGVTSCWDEILAWIGRRFAKVRTPDRSPLRPAHHPALPPPRRWRGSGVSEIWFADK